MVLAPFKRVPSSPVRLLPLFVQGSMRTLSAGRIADGVERCSAGENATADEIRRACIAIVQALDAPTRRN